MISNFCRQMIITSVEKKKNIFSAFLFFRHQISICLSWHLSLRNNISFLLQNTGALKVLLSSHNDYILTNGDWALPNI